jgi:hypothetical protein
VATPSLHLDMDKPVNNSGFGQLVGHKHLVRRIVYLTTGLDNGKCAPA